MNKNTFKSIGAVLAGFLVVLVSSVVLDMVAEKIGLIPSATHPEQYTSMHYAIALSYRLVFTILGGLVTAKLAPQNPIKHAYWLAGIGTIVGTLGSIANWSKVANGGQWYPIALVVLSIPAIIIGAKFKK